MRKLAILIIGVLSVSVSAQTGTWTQETAAAQWAARQGHDTVIFQNRIWVLGGLSTGTIYHNDVWSSADGAIWTLETTSAAWGARLHHRATVFNNRMWVLGGSVGGSGDANDVWSSVDGKTWVLETAAAPWPVRFWHTVEVFSGRMWVIGGRRGNASFPYYADVWSSPDGVNWTLETGAAAFGPRAIHSGAVFGGRLWVIGGSPAVGQFSNQVWSSVDGSTWILAGTAPWSARYGQATAVYDNRIWVLAGIDTVALTSQPNDAWTTADGVTWVQQTAAAPWLGRQYFAADQLGGKLVLAGGVRIAPTPAIFHNDVWSFTSVPTLGVNATAGTPLPVPSNDQGPGGNGIEAAKFEIASNSIAGVSLTQIEVQATGTGNDELGITEVSIYRDADQSGDYSHAGDVPVVTAPDKFTADDGMIMFSLIASEQTFPVNTARTYFVVVKLAGTATPGQTFQVRISDITVVGASAAKIGVPSSLMAGLIVETPLFVFTDASPATPVTAHLQTAGNVCQAFDITYPLGPADKPASVTVNGLGTGDEAADVVAAELWYDANSSATLDAADQIVDTQVFASDNGSVTFNLASHQDFLQGQSRRFFVSYSMGVTAGHQATFKCFVSAAGAGALGGVPAGLPAPGVAGTPGLLVEAVLLQAVLNGPAMAAVVSSDFKGATGDGALLCDVTISAAPGAAWTVTALSFNAGGSGNADTAFSEIGLYEDNGNGTWDGAAIDAPAGAALPGFTGGGAVFNVTSTAVTPATPRRFFLTGKLNGTAAQGETFSARLESASAAPPAGGTTTGFPTPFAADLVIDVPVLSVANGPNQPPDVTHLAGTMQTYLVGRFDLTALNGSVDVSSIKLTTSGSGDWANDIDSVMGVKMYLDDGDNTFSAGADLLVYQGAGMVMMTNANFPGTINVPVSTTVTLWVNFTVAAQAGIGAVAAPETFRVSIANSGDVMATSTVVLGTPAPATAELGAIEFEVTNFQPIAAKPAGGNAITITGKGFMSPFSATIGGVPCLGTPLITSGTQVTGLVVPPGSGQNLPIEVTSGNLPPQVIAQTFTYSNVGTVGGGGKRGGGGGGGCATRAGTGWWMLVTLAGPIALVRRRRLA